MGVAFVALVLGFTVLSTLWEAVQRLRIRERWHATARRLGLRATGAFPKLELSGTFQGAEVHIFHEVEYKYKQEPVITHVARAYASRRRRRSAIEPLLHELIESAPFRS